MRLPTGSSSPRRGCPTPVTAARSAASSLSRCITCSRSRPLLAGRGGLTGTTSRRCAWTATTKPTGASCAGGGHGDEESLERLSETFSFAGDLGVERGSENTVRGRLRCAGRCLQTPGEVEIVSSLSADNGVRSSLCKKVPTAIQTGLLSQNAGCSDQLRIYQGLVPCLDLREGS